MTAETTGARAAFAPDAATGTRVIESIVLRGDLSGLGPNERARFYTQMCEGLGLNPHAQPFAFLKLNGKEVLYATRGATDQLAAMHRLNREIVDGPKVIDLAGTKLVYCCVRATLPNGRTETATATVPLVDPVNVLMKCETKGKRRATLSILGLGMLDETEIETIPASSQEPGGVDLALARERRDEVPVTPTREDDSAPPRGDVPVDAPPPEVPPALEAFYARIAEIELPGEAVAVWMRHSAEIAKLAKPAADDAWTAIVRRTEETGKMRNARLWLKKAVEEERARVASKVAEAS